MSLTALLERTEAILARIRPEGDKDGGQHAGRAGELLARLKKALEQDDIDEMDDALETLESLPLSPDTRDALSGIAEDILCADFKKAGKKIAGLLDEQQDPSEFAERTS
ncbi:MAG: hypothetical protein LBJ82_01520 [Deltaproteobacteria bacterium]|jgi:hypothetical protein|nr:hypothetical protein [Deltaproteobacteria bacterium]